MMFDVTVKTLDSQNHVFNVEEETTVKQFKETICPTIGIPVEQQRLIFRGRVLQDDKPLTEYNVANNVVHVVQRPANQNSTANDEPPARPSSQAGSRLGDGGIFISGDDGGGGRNAVIMGAIGLPQIDIESGDEVLQPRRSGAQVRLMVGNRMLNRASNLLQRLEDSDVVTSTVAASESSSETASGGQESPDVEVEGHLNSNALMEVDDDQDEQDSIEQMISQVVNVSSSAAALVAEIRQVQPGTDSPPANSSSTNTTSTNANTSSLNSNNSSSGSGTSGASDSIDGTSIDVNVNVNAAAPVPGGTASAVAGVGNRNSNNSNNGNSSAPRTSNSTASPSRRPEEPRLRELSTALQDFLALQTRLNPYLRFVQNAIRQNRLYTEQGESESTQFVYDTIFSILHHLSHSLHAFSEIMCDFSVRPEDRRLSATSSILMEQSTVVRATIPVAAVPAAMLAGAAGGAGAPQRGSNNTPGISVSVGSAMPSQQAQDATGRNSSGGGVSATISGPHQATFQLGGGGIQGIPLNIPLNIPGMQGIPGIPVPIQPWRNPNIAANIANAATRGGNSAGVGATVPNNIPQQQQNSSGGGANPSNQFQAGMLPPGLNLGALLGMAGASGGMVNIFGASGEGAPSGQTIPLGSFRIGAGGPGGGGASNNNNSSTTGNSSQQQTSAPPTSTASAVPPQNSAPNASSRAAPNGNQNRNNNNAAMFQNLLNNFNRPQFDPLLPCHTHHTSGRSRTNRPRPAEFRRFVNVEESSNENGVIGRDEAETVEILLDLLRHSSLFDLLQPVIKDVVLNYLMRGRDAKNEAHIKTCAKGLVKKILPFFEKFSAKVGNSDGNVDVLATYSNILTSFLTGLMQKVLGQSPAGDGQFKSELTTSLTDLQRHLIQAFRVCYPSCTNVGLQFVYYFVETCLGGMSLTFKGHVQQKLLEHLKQIEKTTTSDSSKSLIVFKQQASESPSSTGTSATVPSTSAVASNSTTASISSRCAASFVRSASSSADVSMTPPKKPAVSTTVDDVDIDEVLEMPTPPPQSIGAVGGRGNVSGDHGRDTSSIASMLRNLPSEWTDTIEQDIRRQLEMPSQPSFSPGFNTLFPRKH